MNKPNNSGQILEIKTATVSNSTDFILSFNSYTADHPDHELIETPNFSVVGNNVFATFLYREIKPTKKKAKKKAK